jgi:hypothetical protein
MFNVYKNQQSRQTGSRNPMGSKMLPTIWGTYMPPLPEGGGGYTVLPLSVCPSYWYTILWVAFLNPSDSYFLFADLVDLYTH